jgi:hypothetical protein
MHMDAYMQQRERWKKLMHCLLTYKYVHGKYTNV